jgi:hypothetical protein
LGIPLYIILFFFTRFDFFSIVVREHVHAQLQEIVPHSECSR